MRTIAFVSLVLALLSESAVLAEKPRGIAELLVALEAEKERRFALIDLEEMGLDAAPAVPTLIRLLDSPDESIRLAAADALGAVGKDATDAIPKLVDLLGQGELPRISTDMGGAFQRAGIRAALALSQMGPDAVKPLDGVLAHKSAAVRSNAALALQYIGPNAKPAAPSLVRLLRDKDDLVRERAIWALNYINPDSTLTTAPLIECLSDKNFNIRAAAATTLGAIEPTTPAAVKGLIRALGDDHANVQHSAAEALGKLGDDAIPAIPALTESLKNRKAYVYGHPAIMRPVAGTVARSLGMLGPRSRKAMPDLLNLIRDKNGTFDEWAESKSDNREARGLAAIAAARIDPRSDELLRVLDKSLRDDVYTRDEVAVALSLIEPEAKDMVPLLLGFSKPDNVWGGSNCACAAAVIDPGNSLAMKRIHLHLRSKNGFFDGDWDLLRRALARSEGPMKKIIHVLRRMVKDYSEDRENAALALGVLGSRAESAIPAVITLLEDRWEHPRQEAVTALRQIATEDSVALLAALKSPNVNVRSGVAEVLGSFPAAVPSLTEALDDPSARVRLAALVSLAELGEKARPALPRIRKLSQSDSRTIREAAASALQGIEQQ